MLKLIWRTEKIPATWKQAIIIPVLKKCNGCGCKNDRGISLLSITGKLFTSVLQARLQKQRECTAREEQAGFHQGRGLQADFRYQTDNGGAHTMWKANIIIVFIVFLAAFDSVYWTALWRAMDSEHIAPKIVRRLQEPTPTAPVLSVHAKKRQTYGAHVRWR